MSNSNEYGMILISKEVYTTIFVNMLMAYLLAMLLHLFNFVYDVAV